MKWETPSYMTNMFETSKTSKGSIFLERPRRDEGEYGEHTEIVERVNESVDLPSETALTHERAQQLIVEQAQSLLPPSVANALADHLLTCDRCFRFAQDVAHQERQSGKHKAVPPK